MSYSLEAFFPLLHTAYEVRDFHRSRPKKNKITYHENDRTKEQTGFLVPSFRVCPETSL
jgi:hypothetical protein